jgi:hypothetical protein
MEADTASVKRLGLARRWSRSRASSAAATISAAEAVYAEHGREDGDAVGVHDQDFVRLLLPPSLAAVRQLGLLLQVQVQHPLDHIWIGEEERG